MFNKRTSYSPVPARHIWMPSYSFPAIRGSYPSCPSPLSGVAAKGCLPFSIARWKLNVSKWNSSIAVATLRRRVRHFDAEWEEGEPKCDRPESNKSCRATVATLAIWLPSASPFFARPLPVASQIAIKRFTKPRWPVVWEPNRPACHRQPPPTHLLGYPMLAKQKQHASLRANPHLDWAGLDW